MAGHSNKILAHQKYLTRFLAAVFFACMFAVGASFSMALSSAPKPPSTHLTASAAEALAARSAFASTSVMAQGAVVARIDSGTMLFEHNPDIQLPLASLTKVPLTLVVSEVLPTDSIVTIPRDTSFNSKAGQLIAGEQWSAKDLTAYMLVSSYNDVAEILADASEEPLRAKYPQSAGNAALWRMNDLARSLGLRSTYFLNVTGLDESPTQSGGYGSARDMAALFSYMYKNAHDLFAATATSSISIMSQEGRSVRASNTDQIIDELPGIVMGKTGTTDLAGGNLVVVFTANDKTYVAVVLGSSESGRYTDMKKLILATRSIEAK